MRPFTDCASDVEKVPAPRSVPPVDGTRVPIQTLFDYLEAGDSIDEFLEGFPTVTREQVVRLLEEAKNLTLASAA